MAFFQWCQKLLGLLTLKALMGGGGERRRGKRNTFLLLPSMVAEGAGTLAEDAALPLCDPGSIGGIKWHLFTICLFPIGKFRCDKSNKVNGEKITCLSFN